MFAWLAACAVLTLSLLCAIIPQGALAQGTPVGADVPAGAAPTFSERFGVCDPHLMFHDPATGDAVLDHMNEAGIGWVRIVFAWPDVEPLDDTWVFTLADRAARAAREHGLNVLGVLGFSPTWANGGLPYNNPPTPDHYDDWQQYVSTVCGRYAGDVDAWEIWNEENIEAFWQGAPDPATYCAITEAASPAIRAADPVSKVVMGGVAGLGPDFLDACLDLGIAEYVDAVAYHPYVETIGPPTGYAPKESLCRNIVGFVRWLIGDHTTRPLEIWITEFGWTTAEGSAAGVSEATQASYMLRSLVNYAGTEADRTFWYCLWDEEDAPADPAYNLGLLRNDLSHRPAFGYYQTFQAVFGRAVSYAPAAATYSCGTPETLEAHAFALDDGSLALGVWKSDDATDSVTVSLAQAGYERPVFVDPATGKARYVQAYSRDVSGKLTIANLAAGKTPLILLFEKTRPVWYLGEGTTDWGFDMYLTIENPNDVGVTTGIRYMTTSGEVAGPTVALPARSQATVFPRETLGSRDFSTRVECAEGLTIAVDRTMSWNNGGEEGHSSVGVTGPATSWFFPEGSSSWGFETWTVVQNPGDTTASCTLTYMIEGEGPRSFVKQVPPRSRASFDMSADIGAADASIRVSSDVPVVPERAMYRNGRREGHASVGTTSPSTDYYLAEGTTAWGFTTYVLVQNPNSSEVTVTLTYMTPDGPVAQPPFRMPAHSRKTVRANDSLPGTDLSTLVHGSHPVIAERSMYWDSPAGEACHDSIGVESAHMTFLLPDGDSRGDRETWTLVANPNSFDVQVEVKYLTPDGSGNVAFSDTVRANSRRTYAMSDRLADSRASVVVNSKTAGGGIVAERAMYWNNRGAGTDTVGAFSY